MNLHDEICALLSSIEKELEKLDNNINKIIYEKSTGNSISKGKAKVFASEDAKKNQLSKKML